MFFSASNTRDDMPSGSCTLRINISFLVFSDNSHFSLTIGNVIEIVTSCLFHDTSPNFLSWSLVPQLSFAFLDSVPSVQSEVSNSEAFECKLCNPYPPYLTISMTFSLQSVVCCLHCSHSYISSTYFPSLISSITSLNFGLASHFLKRSCNVFPQKIWTWA